jgi:hypothetical protein
MKTIRRVGNGHHFLPDEKPLRYVALRHLRWGAGWLKPGEEVPIEDGRDYGLMIAQGQIAQAIEPTAQEPAESAAEIAQVIQ